jgi:hypothetical protein
VAIPVAILDTMTTLLLKSANASRGGGIEWDPDDYDVHDEVGRVIGRIMRHPQAPKDQPWFWTIVQGIPPAIDSRGYAATREEAMAAFKARWQTALTGRGTND